MEQHLVRQRDADPKQLRGKVLPVARAVIYVGLGDLRFTKLLRTAPLSGLHSPPA